MTTMILAFAVGQLALVTLSIGSWYFYDAGYHELWGFAAVFTLIVGIIWFFAGLMMVPDRYFSEKNCRAIAAHDAQVIDTHFDYFADYCLYELEDGTIIDQDKYQTIEVRS